MKGKSAMRHGLKAAVLGAALWVLMPALAADAPAERPVADATQRLPLLVWPQNQQLARLLTGLGDGSAQQSAAEKEARRDGAVQALLRNVPEVFQGPEQTGIYAVALLLRPDGSVFRIRKVLLPGEQLLGGTGPALTGSGSSLRWNPFFPVFSAGLFNQLSWIRGTPLAAGKVLRIDVALTYGYLPAGYDEAHSPLLVWEAVAARHADLLRPQTPKGNIGSDGAAFNWLVVLMNEDGTIARAHAELVQTAERLAVARVGQTAFDLIANQFRTLQLEPAQLGDMGFMRVTVLPDGTLATSPMLWPDLRDTAARSPLAQREFMVSFAWPRRPGEPAGGVSGESLAQQNADHPLDAAIALAIVEHYFPQEFVAADQPIERRLWVLLSSQGEVLRTGVVPNMFTVTSAAGRAFRLPYEGMSAVQSALPGVRFGVSSRPSSIDSGVIETQVQDRAGRRALVTFLWLAPDSPPPPPQ